MDNMNVTIKRIKEIRSYKGFSQNYMGKLLGITQSAYRKIEIGKTRLTEFRLKKICSILNVQIEEIKVEQKEKTKPSKIKQVVIQCGWIDFMSREGKANLLLDKGYRIVNLISAGGGSLLLIAVFQIEE